MHTEIFGHLDGHAVEAVTLSNGGLQARLITFGARLTELWVADHKGDLADVVLGFDHLENYVASDAFFGATCGQYANRIAGARCEIEGQDIQLDANEGANHLHGGVAGFDRKIWRIAALDDTSVTFSATSEEGEMGFPGRSNLTSRYHLTPEGALEIEMTADTDRTTLVNMVHHSYFNLSGQGTGSVLDHKLQIDAGFYTPVDDALLATGEILSVADTPFDFRAGKRIGQDISALCPSSEGGGYDHNWCLATPRDPVAASATVHDPVSGRSLQISTTEPGLQVYTGGYLHERMSGKNGTSLCKFAGIAMETQKFPGSPTFAHFPDCLLRPGETYRHKMRFQFTADAPSR
ncbi:aldose epimerase family protein [uncultured Roseobacter sp.]|uniref:aldose epimerase family protein n=1 Tax=uncultured Roseobacter sp. TaxID=114847 RepID=UPI002638F3F6|nr:aldose epimerase family protein [uncultured Roseobacter sp.]